MVRMSKSKLVTNAIKKEVSSRHDTTKEGEQRYNRHTHVTFYVASSGCRSWHRTYIMVNQFLVLFVAFHSDSWSGSAFTSLRAEKNKAERVGAN